jgi:hypothetical protein
MPIYFTSLGTTGALEPASTLNAACVSNLKAEQDDNVLKSTKANKYFIVGSPFFCKIDPSAF